MIKNRIRVQRAIKEITQEQLAEAMGVSRPTLNAYETKKYLPSLEMAFKMAAYFGVRIDELFIPIKEDEKSNP